MKDKVRPIYFELQGYLSQAPAQKDNVIFESQVWIQHNITIDELETVTSKKYERYRLHPESSQYGSDAISIQAYRTILGGLISRLHGEYFPDEVSPIIQ
jgi:hypothetical protein